MKYIKDFYIFIKHILQNKELLTALTLNEFKKQYMGSYLGLIWAFVQPVIFMLVIWFVFQIGFRSTPIGDVPLFLWLICAMIPWFFFSDAFSQGTNAVICNAHLVKKVAFRVSVLPVVQIGSVMLIHFVLVGFLVVMLTLYGYYPEIYWLQAPYYIACNVLLLFGITMVTSSIRVFVKDMDNIIGVLLQIGFWCTPVFWSLDLVPLKYQYIIKLNPVYYIVQGFRETFIYHRWFWEHQVLSIYFFTVTIIIILTGAFTFKRLRPHFGDVL